MHHEIAKSTGIEKTIKWGADHIISKFHNYLVDRVSDGIVIVDRLAEETQYSLFVEKFTTGLVYADKTVPLERIKLYASSCDNASHLNSLSDIVIGSFRYCINNPLNSEAAKKMMGNLVQLIWGNKHRSNPDHIDPFEKGLTFRPRPEDIRVPEYKKDYDLLLENLNSLLQ